MGEPDNSFSRLSESIQVQMLFSDVKRVGGAALSRPESGGNMKEGHFITDGEAVGGSIERIADIPVAGTVTFRVQSPMSTASIMGVNRKFLLGALLALALAPTAVQAAEPALKLETTIAIPGKPLTSFDASFVDPSSGLYYLADRSNGTLDVIDVASRKLVRQIGGFVGAVDKGPKSGPDGVVAVPDRQEIWAGDGDSSVKVVSVRPGENKIVASIGTGGQKRVDGLAYDPEHGLILAANNADEPPFLSLISVADRKVLATVPVSEATDGIEQPVYVRETGLFYFSVPSFGDVKNRGAVGVFDAAKRAVVRFLPNMDCLPAGLAHGPGTQLILGCDAGSEETKLPPLTLLVDVANGRETRIEQVGSSDQVWYSPGTHLYYVAARGMPGGPVLGVINATNGHWLENVPTVPRAYSVAAAPDTRTVFMPFPPSEPCPDGCVAVFSSPGQ